MPTVVIDLDELGELDVKGNTRTLAQLLAGLIPDLSKSDPSKLRLALRKKVIIIFHNMPEGDVGLYIMLPANRQGALTIQTTNNIPAGIVVRALEGIQAERLRKDPRLEEAIQSWKEVEAKVEGEHSQHCSAVAAATLMGMLLLCCMVLLRLVFD
jgi:hypothetical protein